jgi:hypothetical protein
MTQVDAWRMVRERALAAGITAPIGNHSFRTTGITAYLANGGAGARPVDGSTREPRTTKLYDRTKERLTQDEIERIVMSARELESEKTGPLTHGNSRQHFMGYCIILEFTSVSCQSNQFGRRPGKVRIRPNQFALASTRWPSIYQSYCRMCHKRWMEPDLYSVREPLLRRATRLWKVSPER